MNVAFREHEWQLGSALGPGLLLQLVEQLSHNLRLAIGTVIGHAAHRDGHLFSAAEPLRAMAVQLDEDKVVVHLEHLLEVIGLQLWSQLASEQHGCLLRGLVHWQQAFHLARLVDGIESLLGVEGYVQVLVADGVADGHKDPLAFPLNDLVSQVRGTSQLSCIQAKCLRLL